VEEVCGEFLNLGWTLLAEDEVREQLKSPWKRFSQKKTGRKDDSGSEANDI